MNRDRIIIFDMDGTLYDLDDVVGSNYTMQIDFLSKKKGFSRKDAVCFLEEHHIYPEMREDSKSATELFLEIGFNKQEWSSFRESRFDVEKIKKSKATDEKVVKSFSQFGIIVLLSSNAYCIIERVLDRLDISPNIFNHIICSDKFPYDEPFKKQLAMNFLAKKYNVCYSNIYSIGDRYATDILPLLELGGKGILLRKPSFMSSVLSDFASGSLITCEEYSFYEGRTGTMSRPLV